MNYRVELLPNAEDSIRKMDTPVRDRILRRIKWLSTNLDIIKHQMLAGKFRGMYKNRIGDYRIIYTFDDKELFVLVVRVGHRKEVYRGIDELV